MILQNRKHAFYGCPADSNFKATFNLFTSPPLNHSTARAQIPCMFKSLGSDSRGERSGLRKAGQDSENHKREYAAGPSYCSSLQTSLQVASIC